MHFHMDLTGQAPRAVTGTSQHQQYLRPQAVPRAKTQLNSPHSSLELVRSTAQTADAFEKQGSKIRKTEVNTANVEIAGTSARMQIWVCLTVRQYFLCRLKVRGHNRSRTYPICE